MFGKVHQNKSIAHYLYLQEKLQMQVVQQHNTWLVQCITKLYMQ